MATPQPPIIHGSPAWEAYHAELAENAREFGEANKAEADAYRAFLKQHQINLQNNFTKFDNANKASYAKYRKASTV